MNLTPQNAGLEIYAIDPRLGAKAFQGTGFDPENNQHRIGSDAVRYAIALQQMRDKGDYATLDVSRRQVEVLGYAVMQELDGTRVKLRQRSKRLTDDECPVIDGILYDAEVPK